MTEVTATMGVFGGSGLYDLAGLEGARTVSLDTPYGPPSDALFVGRIGGRSVAFLARHGRGHRLLPSEINYRANVWAMARLGVERIFSASAVGSLREGIAPRHVVLPDQFIDRTMGRAATFFGEGIAAHVSFADPICPEARGVLAGAAREAGATVHDGGTYVCMEGPAFSTRAESRLYRSWGADVIGMTNLTEAKLAREAQICYATLALVTDWDCWKEDEEAVSVEALLACLRANAALAANALREAVQSVPVPRSCGCGQALATAIVTAPDAIPAQARQRLAHILRAPEAN